MRCNCGRNLPLPHGLHVGSTGIVVTLPRPASRIEQLKDQWAPSRKNGNR